MVRVDHRLERGRAAFGAARAAAELRPRRRRAAVGQCLEDLDYDRTTAVLEALAAGQSPKPGTTTGRKSSEPAGGPTSLKAMVDANHDYRGEWA